MTFTVFQKIQMLMLRLVSFIFFVCSFAVSAKFKELDKGPSLVAPPGIRSALLDLVNEAAELHKAIQAENDLSLEIKIQKLQSKIQSIYRKLPLMSHPQEKDHTFRLLGVIDERLEGLKIQGKDNLNKKSVKRLFSTIAELAKAYHVKTASSGIFYCSQDRSLWLQSNGKPKNPVNPHLKNCGRRVW